MSRFIISRTPAGEQFILRSDTGRLLVVSKVYATLDACKKAICSLVGVAAAAPLVDLTAGEYASNPKIEIYTKEQGVCYAVKAPNGKTVLTRGPFATRKAALRAIAMLRAAMDAPAVVMETPKGVVPLAVKALDQKTKKAR